MKAVSTRSPALCWVALKGNPAPITPEQQQLLADTGKIIEIYVYNDDDALTVIWRFDVMTATSESLGKTAGKDAAAGKNTWVSLLGLEQAQVYAHELAELARQSIADSASAGELLFDLPQWLIEREN